MVDENREGIGCNTLGALSVVKKGLEENTRKILGTIKSSELQKIMLLGTAHFLRFCPQNESTGV